MPARNIVKEYVAESYYHIYNRGANKAAIFRDIGDMQYFVRLIDRYLGSAAAQKPNRAEYPSFVDIELLAYCLMRNHFHLLIYQTSQDGIARFMKSLSTSYAMYFSKKYRHTGAVFQQRYRAVRITEDSQLMHISRYIHLNPHDYETYPWSSYQQYVGGESSDWLKPERILAQFDNPAEYAGFVADYRDRRDELAALKDELADANT